jgi:hypothetical protein
MGITNLLTAAGRFLGVFSANPLDRADAARALDEIEMFRRHATHLGAPFGRSRHTVAQDKRAAKKRRAVRRAKARGQA